MYYAENYGDFLEGQNRRNEAHGHANRNRTVDDLLVNKTTCPEETVYQIGTIDEHVSEEVLFNIVTDFLAEFTRRFGSHVHILDFALHCDEGTPHIQERHVFDALNQYGELCPQQEKALEELGFELPHPDKPKSKYNRRKNVFDAACREMLFDITERYGLHLDREPSYGGRAYLEKQDYILMKQKEKLAVQEKQIEQRESELEELSIRIDDVETLIDEVAETAYDKAVETVTERVQEETHNADFELIRDYEKRIPGNLLGISRIGLDLTDGVVTEVFDQMGVYRADKDPGIGEGTEDWLMISASALHHRLRLAIQGQDVISKAFQLTGRVCNIEGFPDNSTSRLQDRHGALALRNINTDCVVHCLYLQE